MNDIIWWLKGVWSGQEMVECSFTIPLKERLCGRGLRNLKAEVGVVIYVYQNSNVESKYIMSCFKQWETNETNAGDVDVLVQSPPEQETAKKKVTDLTNDDEPENKKAKYVACVFMYLSGSLCSNLSIENLKLI